jgi:hypothetical protein
MTGGVAVKELDMGFTAEEVAEGMGRLLGRLGVDGIPTMAGGAARFRGPDGVEIEVRPMPEERIHYPILFPRTLVRLEGGDAAVRSLEQKILLAFLRVGG